MRVLHCCPLARAAASATRPREDPEAPSSQLKTLRAHDIYGWARKRFVGMAQWRREWRTLDAGVKARLRAVQEEHSGLRAAAAAAAVCPETLIGAKVEWFSCAEVDEIDVTDLEVSVVTGMVVGFVSATAAASEGRAYWKLRYEVPVVDGAEKAFAIELDGMLPSADARASLHGTDAWRLAMRQGRRRRAKASAAGAASGPSAGEAGGDTGEAGAR